MQIGLSRAGILMDAIEMRLIPAAHEIEFGRPARRSRTDQANGLDECRPMLGGHRRRFRADETVTGSALVHPSSVLAAFAGPAGQQLNDAETGDAVARVFGKPQHRQHVLDVRGFQKFQAAEFHEGNVAAGQFDFERPAVMRGAKQHRLRFQRKPGFAASKTFRHVARLAGLVANATSRGRSADFRSDHSSW